MVEKLNFALRRVENMVVKGENAGYQHFLLLPPYFQNAFFSGSLSRNCVEKGYTTKYIIVSLFFPFLRQKHHGLVIVKMVGMIYIQERIVTKSSSPNILSLMQGETS